MSISNQCNYCFFSRKEVSALTQEMLNKKTNPAAEKKFKVYNPVYTIPKLVLYCYIMLQIDLFTFTKL